MVELGSEYSLSLSDLTVKDNNINKYLSCYQYKCFFDSGRSVIKHLASFFNSTDEILLPEFICESVINCFNSEIIRFFKLNDDFSIDIESIKALINQNTRAIFLMHYFGGIQPQEQLTKLKIISEKYNIIIIEDTTHSFFSRSDTIGDYQVCSIRKWLPVPSGGVLYSTHDPLAAFKDIHYSASTDNDRSYGMILKELFLSAGFNCNEEYRKIFRECENRLDLQSEAFLLSDFSRFIVSCVDVEQLVKVRKRNYSMLNSELSKMGLKPAIQLQDDNCPLVLPIRVRNRDLFRSFLMDNRIYCAVHWPFDGMMEASRSFAVECARSLISLPIDQRYKKDDIWYMAKVIHGYGEKLIC